MAVASPNTPRPGHNNVIYAVNSDATFPIVGTEAIKRKKKVVKFKYIIVFFTILGCWQSLFIFLFVIFGKIINECRQLSSKIDIDCKVDKII